MTKMRSVLEFCCFYFKHFTLILLLLFPAFHH